MAPKTTDRVGLDLGFLLGDAEMLAETLPEWDEISEAERSIWLFDRRNDVAILDNLERSLGAMTGGQRVRYGELLKKLREITPAPDETALAGRPR